MTATLRHPGPCTGAACLRCRRAGLLPELAEAWGGDVRGRYPCADRGDRAGDVPCKSCGPGRRLITYECRRHGGRATLATAAPDLLCCRTCLEDGDPRPRLAHAPAAVAPPWPLPAIAGPPLVGVVVGTWGPAAPALIRLQARWLRRTCPGVPLLIADDLSDDGPGVEAAARDEGCALVRSPVRLGHAAGDLAALWWGLVWGLGLGCSVVVKLSQRFLPTSPAWAVDTAAELLGTGTPPLPLATARSDGPDVWPYRTECAAYAVDRWRPALAELSPRPHPGRHAEHVLSERLARLPGPSNICWPLSWLPPHRGTRGPFLWHQSDTRAAYVRAAAAVGLVLPPAFTTAPSGQQEGYQP